jgi:ribosomal protein S9
MQSVTMGEGLDVRVGATKIGIARTLLPFSPKIKYRFWRKNLKNEIHFF